MVVDIVHAKYFRKIWILEKTPAEIDDYKQYLIVYQFKRNKQLKNELK